MTSSAQRKNLLIYRERWWFDRDKALESIQEKDFRLVFEIVDTTITNVDFHYKNRRIDLDSYSTSSTRWKRNSRRCAILSLFLPSWQPWLPVSFSTFSLSLSLFSIFSYLISKSLIFFFDISTFLRESSRKNFETIE